LSESRLFAENMSADKNTGAQFKMGLKKRQKLHSFLPLKF